ncbi:hypothetical protein EYC98_10585 [Halieaceae bacterium IMCC14734]|uniref:Glycosyltransferase n=1 Tax=Candidatus Litorirhabdus singularis TaxID=2518993 RepID=A0ABT3TG73_9GAMM|nr:hypothetical protein [Candidatus Litorirhabdus singularis]MCX2981310.1 hypothetical protein [Candidatus Litorirhabdus singularis]
MESKHDPSLVIVSLVYHDAVDMTLLAINSFLSQIRRGRVELIDDGSLTPQDYQILTSQIQHLKIVHISEIDVGSCPRGGCWERLVHILRLSEHSYVVQVDTDTLTLGVITEVDQAIRDNGAFTIGGPMFAKAVHTDYMAMLANRWDTEHVQALGERQLSTLESIELEYYCRGCAAFTGFPKGGSTVSTLQQFSDEMDSRLGSHKWCEWGSEQLASNVMISLTLAPQILPWPKYQNFGFPEIAIGSKLRASDFSGKTSVIHFIGSNRYDGGIYRELAEAYISRQKTIESAL